QAPVVAATPSRSSKRSIFEKSGTVRRDCASRTSSTTRSLKGVASPCRRGMHAIYGALEKTGGDGDGDGDGDKMIEPIRGLSWESARSSIAIDPETLSHLDQVLFSIALVFMAVAAADWSLGSSQMLITLPDWLQGRIELAGVAIGRYRAFLILVCAALVVGLQLVLSRARFGARLRAAVDDQRAARGLGVNVGAIFAATFAVGSSLAGLGGALGIEIMGFDPTFPLKIMVYVLIVVTIGGTAGLTGPFLAALIIGTADVAGKNYIPELGAFLIYLLMIVLLILRSQGLIAPAR
ncbi:hypothetical protein RGQ15_16620, partial [Paracoccus sp. MBLB3053]